MESIFDTYRTEPEVIYPIPSIGGNGEYDRGEMSLRVGKVGGGRLGESYEGHWFMEVTHNGETIYSSQDFNSATERDHLQAAIGFASMVSPEEGEEDRAEYPFGERLREWLENYVGDIVIDIQF